MCSVNIIDLVTFFTVDNPFLLETLPSSLLDSRLSWLFSQITPACHHLLGVGTLMVQFDIPIFLSLHSLSEKSYLVPQLCPLESSLRFIFTYSFSNSRLISLNAHSTL